MKKHTKRRYLHYSFLMHIAAWPLLKKSEAPMFVAISTGASSIWDMGGIPLAVTAELQFLRNTFVSFILFDTH